MPAETVVVQAFSLGLPCRADLKVCTTSDDFFTRSKGLPTSVSGMTPALQ